ncbi:uncharacterized protein LOC141915269 [Tubulanus polymorphus]|uniref:uncharacterized protein LOC141915269 n=1 Tax=Tubulanus polymorphus TaxID=672921 RepID=UPI003DA59ED7
MMFEEKLSSLSSAGLNQTDEYCCHAAGMMSNSASKPELFLIINFFEHIPPPPSFPSFKAGFMHVVKVVQKHPQFIEGMLLRDVNETPRFPYINFAVFDTGPRGIFQHDPDWIQAISEGHGTEQIHHQAGFMELQTLHGPETPSLPKIPPNKTTAYIITAFKAEGDFDRLDRTWNTWSGSDFIQAYIPPELSLKRITIHKRIVTHGTFVYALMCELSEGVTYLNRARDFIERLNERNCGYSALYLIDEIY